MKRSRAVHHLEELARSCADMAGRPATIFPLRVQALWTFAEMLGGAEDLDSVPVVLGVDLPVADVAWLCAPPGAEHWSHAAGLSNRPVVAIWRSTRAPVWNHRIRGPLLIWEADGAQGHSDQVAAHGLSALRAGTAQRLRLPAPTTAEMAARLEAELAVSLRGLEAATAAYEQRRFGPGRLEPVADALWRASAGYLDVLTATR